MKETKIGLGMAAIGRPEYINLRKEDDANKSEVFYRERALKLLDFAYLKGIRNFDTAPSYGKGEEFLKEWNNQNRYHDVNLSSKWGYTYVADWKIGFKGAHEIKDHSLDKLKEQWLDTKELLPALKIYQIHSATFESEVLKNNDVLNELSKIKRETGIKIGLSVSGSDQSEILSTAMKIEKNQQLLFDSFQVTYNILETSTHNILKKLIESGKTVIIKEALANGRIFRSASYRHYADLYATLKSLSKIHKVGVDAIALRFIMDYLEPALVLSGAASKQQLSENLLASTFQLSSDEIQSLQRFAIESSKYWMERKELSWN